MKTLKNDLQNLRLILDRVQNELSVLENKQDKTDADYLNQKKVYKIKDSLEDSICLIEHLIVK